MKAPKGKLVKQDSPAFILGRAKFERISAVEGIMLSRAMKSRAAKSDRDNLSADERRCAIIAAYRKP